MNIIPKIAAQKKSHVFSNFLSVFLKVYISLIFVLVLKTNIFKIFSYHFEKQDRKCPKNQDLLMLEKIPPTLFNIILQNFFLVLWIYISSLYCQHIITDIVVVHCIYEVTLYV